MQGPTPHNNAASAREADQAYSPNLALSFLPQERSAFGPRTILKQGNGTLLHTPTPQLGIGCAKLHLLSGIINEEPSHSGIHHLLEHVYTKTLIEAINQPGRDLFKSNLNAETDFDGITFTWWGDETQVDDFLRLLGKSILEAPPISAAILQTEQNAIDVEIAIRSQRPSVRQTEDLLSLIYPNSFFTRPVAGVADTVASMTTLQLSNKLTDILHSRGWILSTTGGSRSAAVSLLEEYARPLDQESYGQHSPIPDAGGPEVLYRKLPGGLTGVAVGFPTLPITDPRHVELEVCSRVIRALAQAELREVSGTIWEPLKELRVETKQAGLYGLSAKTCDWGASRTLSVINDIVARVATGSFSDKLFEQKKAELIDEIRGVSGVASAVAGYSLDCYLGKTPFKDLSALEDYACNIDRLSARAVAQAVFVPHFQKVVVYGSEPLDLELPVRVGKPFFDDPSDNDSCL